MRHSCRHNEEEASQVLSYGNQTEDKEIGEEEETHTLTNCLITQAAKQLMS